MMTSRNLLSKFRNGRKAMSVLIAFSAVVTSLKPFVNPAAQHTAFTLSVLAVVSASIALVAFALEYVVMQMERYGRTFSKNYDKI